MNPFGPALSPVADNASRPLSVLDSNCISRVTIMTSSSAFVAGHASYFASSSAVKGKAKTGTLLLPHPLPWRRLRCNPAKSHDNPQLECTGLREPECILLPPFACLTANAPGFVFYGNKASVRVYY
ncbi:hypothetical protein TorRG33x02_130700 [Trema orientale]|uniref:Uncharacterized protein n=1 Tax=Trema orientale TaxID=63057 RepID=A0A2P5EZS4_TREOI|nr:hypothetical protein TorRG33x02_130700 [Trema orientale]